MSKRVPCDDTNYTYTFTVTLKTVDNPKTKHLSIEAVIGGRKFEDEYEPYDAHPPKKLRCRMNYISQRLEEVLREAALKLWNVSAFAAEKDEGYLKHEVDLRREVNRRRARRGEEFDPDLDLLPEHGDLQRWLGIKDGRGGKGRKKKETLSTNEKRQEFKRIVDAVYPSWKENRPFPKEYPAPVWLLPQPSERKKRERQRRLRGETVKRNEDSPKGMAYKHAFRIMYQDEITYPKIPGYKTLDDAYFDRPPGEKITSKPK